MAHTGVFHAAATASGSHVVVSVDDVINSCSMNVRLTVDEAAEAMNALSIAMQAARMRALPACIQRVCALQDTKARPLVAFTTATALHEAGECRCGGGSQ